MTGSRVDFDFSEVELGVRQLAAGLDRRSTRVGLGQATRTASAIRAKVPRRTGRLAATVRAVPTSDGADVTYGGSLRYASYIEKRTGAVASAQQSAPAQFGAAMTAAAASEVSRL